MPRPRRRVCLQEGLHLDLNQRARDGFIRRGTRTDPRNIRWTHPHWGEIASGFVSTDKARGDFAPMRMGPPNISRIGSRAAPDKAVASALVQIKMKPFLQTHTSAGSWHHLFSRFSR